LAHIWNGSVSHDQRTVNMLRHTARIRVYLPVSRQWTTAEKDGEENGDPSGHDESESKVNSLMVVESILVVNVSNGTTDAYQLPGSRTVRRR
jgi:hypothetical protein